jgi:hypothetical protein
VSAPVLGHFFEGDRHQLLPIIGSAGSGFLGSGVASVSGSSVIRISPAQDYLLAVLPESGQLASVVLDQETYATRIVRDAIPDVSSIAISPSGSAAVVYSAKSRKAQVFTGFPNSGALVRQFDWAALPGELTASAIDDEGSLVLIAAQTSLAALLAFSDEGGGVMIYSTQTISSIEFVRHSRQAVAALPAANQVIWIRDTVGGPSPELLANASTGVLGPLAVMPSQDGNHVFILDTEGVLRLPLAGGKGTRISCGCQATGLQRMRGRDVLLLTPSVGASLTILDGSGNSPVLARLSTQIPHSAMSHVENKQ